MGHVPPGDRSQIDLDFQDKSIKQEPAETINTNFCEAFFSGIETAFERGKIF